MFLECIHPLRYDIIHISFREILHLETWEFNLHGWLFFLIFLLLNKWPPRPRALRDPGRSAGFPTAWSLAGEQRAHEHADTCTVASRVVAKDKERGQAGCRGLRVRAGKALPNYTSQEALGHAASGVAGTRVGLGENRKIILTHLWKTDSKAQKKRS